MTLIIYLGQKYEDKMRDKYETRKGKIMENKNKELKGLIKKGYDLELISYEFDVPIEELQEMSEQIQIEKDNKKRMRREKKNQKPKKEEIKTEFEDEMPSEEVSNTRTCEDYKKLIERYKIEIDKHLEELKEDATIRRISSTEKQMILTKLANKRNLLAYAYYNAGLIEESRKELLSLINKESNHTAYRQIIHLEKAQGNIDDAKIWAYEGIEMFPKDIKLRKQLALIAREEHNKEEENEQLRAIEEIIQAETGNINYTIREKIQDDDR